MRVLRTSLYVTADPRTVPVTTIVRDSDITDTLESMRASLLDIGVEGASCYTHFDLFEMEDGDEIAASARAIARQDRLAESNCAMLYFWTLETLEVVREGGVLFMDKPAPLSAEQMIGVHQQVVLAPAYRKQEIVGYDKDGIEARVTRGKFYIDGEEV